MNRQALFLPLAALVVLTGYLGLRLGQPPSETEIIARYAARYVAEAGPGAQVTDCAAAPHPQARMVVVCHHSDGASYRYVVGARGGLIRSGGPSA